MEVGVKNAGAKKLYIAPGTGLHGWNVTDRRTACGESGHAAAEMGGEYSSHKLGIDV
jgi:hypothetical protein